MTRVWKMVPSKVCYSSREQTPVNYNKWNWLQASHLRTNRTMANKQTEENILSDLLLLHLLVFACRLIRSWLLQKLCSTGSFSS